MEDAARPDASPEPDASSAPSEPRPTEDARSGSSSGAGMRGSALLLGGRMVAVGLNFLVQVFAVRYFLREEFGSFSFALSVAALGTNLNLLGLSRALSRLAPVYAERREHQHLVGAIVYALGAIAVLGLMLVGLFYVRRDSNPLADDELTTQLLVLLIVLTPLGAIDAVLEVLCASFAGARAIFFRRHLMTPLLRLGAVLGVLSAEGSVVALAYAYVGVSVVGIVAYASILRRALGRRGIRISGGVDRPPRSLFRMGAAMLVVDLAAVSSVHLPIVVVEHFEGPAAAAGLRAVDPLAGLSLVVLQSMMLLLVPMAARLNERGDTEALSDLFWIGVRWIVVLSFPVFAVTTFLAPQIVPLLFGDSYSDASILAAILTAGVYVYAPLGVCTIMLQALGRARRMATLSALTFVAAIALNLLLVERLGAHGAALASAFTMIFTGALGALMLQRSGVIRRPTRGTATTLSIVAAATGLLVLTVWIPSPPAPYAVTTVLAVVSLVLLGTRRSLGLLEAFPELGRSALLRRLLA